MRVALVVDERAGFLSHTGLDLASACLEWAVAQTPGIEALCTVIPHFAAVTENLVTRGYRTDEHSTWHGHVISVTERGLDESRSRPVFMLDSGTALERLKKHAGSSRVTWVGEHCDGRGRFSREDMAEAMITFNKEVAEWLEERGPGWLPDVIHCVGWGTALVPAFLRRRRWFRGSQGVPPVSVLTLDLLNLPGIVDSALHPGAVARWSPLLGLPESTGAINFLLEGIKAADLIHVPSAQWRDELLSSGPDQELIGALRKRDEDRAVVPAPFGVRRKESDFNWETVARTIPAQRGVAGAASRLLAAKAQARKSLEHELHWDSLGTGPLFVAGNRVSADDQKNYRAVVAVFRAIFALHADARLLLRLFPSPGTDPSATPIWDLLEAFRLEFPSNVLISPLDGGPHWSRLLLASDVALIPSRWEPGGQNHLQALALGCPVIATRKGTMPEALRHGYNGWLIDDPDDYASFAECCETAIACREDVTRWAALAETAVESTIDWDWPVIAEKAYLPMYEHVIGSTLGHISDVI